MPQKHVQGWPAFKKAGVRGSVAGQSVPHFFTLLAAYIASRLCSHAAALQRRVRSLSVSSANLPPRLKLTHGGA